MNHVFFNGWESLLRVIMSAALTYVAIVLALRIAGAPALAKMSGYDMIVTVALGSLVAAVLLTKSISVTDGIAAIATFLILQEVTRWLQTRSLAVHHLVRERPHLVVWDGKILDERLLAIDVTSDEVRAAIRRAGFLSISQVQAVTLENDGEWSVMPRSEVRDLSALEGLEIPGHSATDDSHALVGQGRGPRVESSQRGGPGAQAPVPSSSSPL